MDTTGIQETEQVVRVTADGTDRFFRISTDAAGTACRGAADVGRIISMLFSAEKRDRADGLQNHAGKSAGYGRVPTDSLLESSGRSGVLGASIDSIDDEKFESYAVKHKLPYAVLDSGGGQTYVIYPADRYRAVMEYAHTGEKVQQAEVMSVQTYQSGKTFSDLDSRNTYCVINNADIVSADAQKVRLRMGDKQYMDVPAEDIIKDDSTYRVRFRPEGRYVCVTAEHPEGTAAAGSRASGIYDRNVSRERHMLRERIDKMYDDGDIDFAARTWLKSDVPAHRRDINSRYRSPQYGLRQNGRAVVFKKGSFAKAISHKQPFKKSSPKKVKSGRTRPGSGGFEQGGGNV